MSIIRKAVILLLTITSLTVTAQRRTTMATQYREFKPSVITLKDGRRLPQPLTNVFLKNSSLLYLSGTLTKEANMDNVAAVEFDDRHYITINRQLAYIVDSTGHYPLYCIELFDLESYERNLRNNNNFTNIEIGDQLSTTTVDLNTEEDHKFPVFRHFYTFYNGKFVRMHERDLWRELPKEKRHIFKSVTSLDTFSWTDEASLIQLLSVM